MNRHDESVLAERAKKLAQRHDSIGARIDRNGAALVRNEGYWGTKPRPQRLDLGVQAVVALFLGEQQHRFKLIRLFLELLILGERLLERPDLLIDLVGLFHIVPEAGLFHL